MKRVVQKLDVIGPCVLGIFIQSVHITLESAIGEKTECTGDLDGIIEPAGGNIGLPNNGYTCSRSAHKSTFHRSERYRLVITDHLGLLVPGRKGHKNGRDQSNERSRAQVKLTLARMEP